jgi:hypothetical protein
VVHCITTPFKGRRVVLELARTLGDRRGTSHRLRRRTAGWPSTTIPARALVTGPSFAPGASDGGGLCFSPSPPDHSAKNALYVLVSQGSGVRRTWKHPGGDAPGAASWGNRVRLHPPNSLDGFLGPATMRIHPRRRQNVGGFLIFKGAKSRRDGERGSYGKRYGYAIA